VAGAPSRGEGGLRAEPLSEEDEGMSYKLSVEARKVVADWHEVCRRLLATLRKMRSVPPGSWVCTSCGRARLGERFEERTLGGDGPRTCVVCGVVRDRNDGMHLV